MCREANQANHPDDYSSAHAEQMQHLRTGLRNRKYSAIRHD